MLAYGWVFHMGLFNFYISLGLCFGSAGADCGAGSPGGNGRGGSLWAVAYVAHALPVAWAVGMLVYGRIAQSLAPRRRFWVRSARWRRWRRPGCVLGALCPTRRDAGPICSHDRGGSGLGLRQTLYRLLRVAVLAVWALCFGTC